MRLSALSLAFVFAATIPSLASDDPDRAGAPQTAAPATSERSAAVAPESLGTCTATDLRGRWNVIVDHDLGTAGTRALLISCRIRIGNGGAIAASECVRQSTEFPVTGFSGNLRVLQDCRVANLNNATPVSFYGSVLRVVATMSGDRTRISGTIVGFNTGTLRGTFQAIRVP